MGAQRLGWCGENEWNFFGNVTFNLPEKVQLTGDFNGGADSRYNITTGFDNNGDGDFNDRPQYAAPGTPGAVATPYGLLVASGGTGVSRRESPANESYLGQPQRAYAARSAQKCGYAARI